MAEEGVGQGDETMISTLGKLPWAVGEKLSGLN